MRRWFQQYYFRKWAGKRIGAEEGKKRSSQGAAEGGEGEGKAGEEKTAQAAKHLDEAEADLVRLATAGDDEAFYDLAIEQMCGQMNAAAQVVLEYPERHKELLLLLAAQARPDDIQTVLGFPKPLKRKVQTARLHELSQALVVMAAYWWLGGTDAWTAVLIAFLAGFFAPIARDLLAALQKLRAS